MKKLIYGRVSRIALTLLLIASMVIVALCFAFVAPKSAKAEELTAADLELVTAAGWLNGGTASTDAEIDLGTGVFDDEKKTCTYTIEIGSAKQLARLAYLVANENTVEHNSDTYYVCYNVTLIQDIDLENKLWIPIGSMKRGTAWNGNVFRGNIIGAKGGVEGNSVTISNLNSDPFYNHVDYGTLDGGASSYYVDCGSFGKIPFEIKGDEEYCYGLIGSAAGVKIGSKTELKIENINIVGIKIDIPNKTLSGGKIFNNDRCGTLVGYLAGNLVMRNCVAGQKGDYIKNAALTGGLIGNVYGGYTDGNPTGSSGTDTNGYIEIENCKNYIDIGIEQGASTNQKGGIVGYMYHTQRLAIENCENYGTIYGYYVGGISSYIQTVSNFQGTVDNPIVHDYSFIDCINYGDIYNIFSNGNSTDPYIAGGIMGRFIDYWAGKDDIARTDYTFRNCINNGNVTGVGTSSVGGILGELRSNSEFGNIDIDRCYNYGDITAENGRVGGVIGYCETFLSYGRSVNGSGFVADRVNNVNRNQNIIINTSIGNAGKVSGDGLNVGGAIGGRKVFSLSAVNGDVNTEGTPKWYLKKRFEDGHIIINDNIVNAYKLENIVAPGEVTATETATLELSADNKTIIGLATVPEGNYRIQIPASVETIGAEAFKGQLGLVEILFEDGSRLKTISDWAFAGTNISKIELPQSVETIGRAAFGGCASLIRVIISDGVKTIEQAAFGNGNVDSIAFSGTDITCGNYAFDSGMPIIAEDSAHYAILKASDKLSDEIKQELTYPVTINYYHSGVLLDSETRLYGRGYEFDQNNSEGIWKYNENAKLGTAYATAKNWYKAEDGSNEIDLDGVNEILNHETNLPSVINLYSNDNKVFVPRNDIVYDGTEYTASQLNSLLSASSDSISGAAEITKYVPFVGTEKTSGITKICDAGVYTVVVTEGANNIYEFDITVLRAPLDLGLYSNLRWLSGGEELLSGKVGSENVIRSIARYNSGTQLTVSLGTSDKFTAGALSGNTATEANNTAHTASVTLTASNNYEFVFNGADSGYGLSVTVSDDGQTAQVQKIWYAQAIDNWFVSGGSGDVYTIENRAFSDNSVFASPRIRFSDENPYEKLTFNLTYNGEKVNGDTAFSLADFAKYLNSAMPVGKYELEVKAAETSHNVYNESGEVTGTVEHRPFDRTYEFEILPAGYNANQLAQIDEILKGKAFRFDFDGNSHLLSTADRQAVNAVFERMDRPQRTGTVWADEKYDSLYGDFELVFNIARTQMQGYAPESGLTIETNLAQRYTVYYAVSAPNHSLSVSGMTEDERTARSFAVVNVRKIDVPTLLSKPYNGSLQVADVSKLDNSLYTIVNEGGTNVGKYTVTLKFIDPECYEWNGVGGAEAEVEFEITKASNDWIVKPTINNWVVGKYDSTENAIFGSSLFGYENIRYVITDANDESKVLFDSSTDSADKLSSLKVGNYYIKVTIEGNDNFNTIESSMLFHVFKKPGLAWWGVMLIIIASLAVAAGVFVALWKAGIIDILTAKVSVAIRTRAATDAVIASVRANKVAEAAKVTVAKAKAKERAAERRAKMLAEKNLPPEQKVAALEAKAAIAAERAEKMRMRSEAIRAQAEQLKMQELAQAEAAATTDKDKE